MRFIDPAWPTRADGACVHLNADNSCAIYETRPPICRVDESKPADISVADWHRLNADVCKALQEEEKAMDLEAVRKRCDAATEGPWDDQVTEINQHWEVGSKTVVGLEECGTAYNPWHRLVLEEADRAFIAHARTDLPLAIAEIERLREALREVVESLASLNVKGTPVTRLDTRLGAAVKEARAALGDKS